ncbi:MAG: PA4642 family protein [Moraxellaceae bacterium]|jgi:hypothetical protein|nr:PA4642 family protein [Moraxellaceae bacterium]MCC6199894.1 PA4642 family protein [Moraxellaceae bacterium]HQV40630.1 PA4642 family protein [Moraxellaceae bacterium]HQX89119.1 PA4642 family protein [Moraxellaceae bacterium]
MGVSQPARFGEDWSDERVRGFLDRQPADGSNADFHVLMSAYKHMRPHDFERLLGFFVAAGRDLNATDSNGHTLLALAREHVQSADFVTLLEQAGAN